MGNCVAVSQQAGKRISIATRLQCSVAVSSVALVISLSLSELAATSWIPDSISGVNTVNLAIYLFGFLIGSAACWRRNSMPIVTRSMGISARAALLVGLIAAAMPTTFIWLTESLGRDQVIVIGLAVCLLIIIGAGFVRTADPRAANRQNPIPSQFAASIRQYLEKSVQISALGVASRTKLRLLDRHPVEGSWATILDTRFATGGTTGNLTTAAAKLGATVTFSHARESMPTAMRCCMT